MTLDSWYCTMLFGNNNGSYHKITLYVIFLFWQELSMSQMNMEVSYTKITYDQRHNLYYVSDIIHMYKLSSNTS